MLQLTQAVLERLAKTTGWPCVSIYLPLHPEPARRGVEPLEARHLFDQAEEQCIAQGMRGPEARALLEDPRTFFAKERNSLPLGTTGIAMFRAPDFWEVCYLNETVPAQCTVASDFYLRPLVRSLENDQPFLVLAATVDKVRLYSGNRRKLQEIETGLTNTLDEWIQVEERQRMLTRHQHPSNGAGNSTATYHGQGGPGDTYKKEAEQFFLAVKQTLAPWWRNQRAPMIFAGVEYLFPIFKNHCDYPHLQNAHIQGSPEKMSQTELHAKAEEIMQGNRPAPPQSPHEADTKAASSGLAERDLVEIIRAATLGSVSTLYVTDHPAMWGYVGEDQEPHAATDGGPDRIDLVNLAMLQTLRTGGEIRWSGENGNAFALLRFRPETVPMRQK